MQRVDFGGRGIDTEKACRNRRIRRKLRRFEPEQRTHFPGSSAVCKCVKVAGRETKDSTPYVWAVIVTASSRRLHPANGVPAELREGCANWPVWVGELCHTGVRWRT